MADNNLHIKVFPKTGQTYDESWGLLTLQNAQEFEFGIKECFDEMEPIQKKYDEDKKIEANRHSKELAELDEKDKFGRDFINKKYEEINKKNQIGAVSKEAMDNYKANLDAYNKGIEERKLKRNKAKETNQTNLDKLDGQFEEKKKEIEGKYKNVRWVRQLVGLTKPNLGPNSFNESMGESKVHFNDEFNKFLEGGGNVYIEPFLEGTTPRGSTPHGLYVKAIGEPKILAAQWTDTDNNNIDKQKIKYGSTVRLHTYTQGMYGKYINVQLMDQDLGTVFDPDDELKVYGAEQKARKEYNGNGAPSSNDKQIKAPVLVFLEEEDKIPSEALRGNLIVQDGILDKKNDRKPYVQKSMFDIYIDPFWQTDGGEEEIELYPKIYYTKKDGTEGVNAIEYCLLEIGKGEKFRQLQTITVGNSPVIVGTVETDIAEFHPCRYDEIKVTVEKEIAAMNDTDKREIIIYSKEDKNNKMYLQPIEMVAGFKENLAEVIIDLKNLKTDNCRYGKTNPHKNRVIDITPFQGKKSWKGEGDKNNMSDGVSLNGVEGKTQIIGAENAFGYIEHTDEKLRFQVAYIYQAAKSYEVLKYFIPSKAKTFSINIPIETCHKGKVLLKVIVYPDIKWTLKIAFNFDRVDIPKLETSIVEKEEYVTIYLPIPDVVLQYVKHSVYFEQREVMKKKMTVASVDLSLTAQLDQEDDDHYSTEVSVSGNIKHKIEEQLKKLGIIGELMQKLFDGSPVEENDATQKGKPLSAKDKQKVRKKLGKFIDGGIEEYLEGDISKESLNKKRKKLEKSLKKNFEIKKRPVVEPEIIWPSLGMSFSWSLSEGKTASAQKKYISNKTGYKLEAAVFADPIIGMGAKLDFLGLIAKAHPIATAIILVIDVASSLAGINIDLYFQAEGKFAGEVNGFLDTLTGDNSFNRDSLNETGEKVAKIEGSLKFTLEGSVSMAGEANAILFKVSAEGEASIKAESEFKIAFGLQANEKGFYLQPIFTFEGLEIEANAKIKVTVKTKGGISDEEEDDGEENDGLSVSGSYQVIDRVIKKLKPIELYE